MIKNPFRAPRWYPIGFASLGAWMVGVATLGLSSWLWEPIALGFYAVPSVLGGAAAATYAGTGRRTWPDAAVIAVGATGAFSVEIAIVWLLGVLVSTSPSALSAEFAYGIVYGAVVLVGFTALALPFAIAGAFIAWRWFEGPARRGPP